MTPDVLIQTRTPIHIGNGITYSTAEAYRDKAFLIRIKFWDLFSKMNEKQLQQYKNAIESDNTTEIAIILKTITAKHESLIRYKYLYKTRKNIESSKDQIREIIKDSNNIPFIPGSSIKGAIRTALMYHAISKNQYIFKPISKKLPNITIIDLIKQTLKSKGKNFEITFNINNKKYKIQIHNTALKDNKTIIKTNSKIIEKFVFNLETIKIPKNNIIKLDKVLQNAQYDILKFLQISDFHPINSKYKCWIDNVITYSMNKEKKYKAKNFTNHIEVLTGEFQGNITLSPQIKWAIKNKKIYPLLHKKLYILGLNENDLQDIKAAEIKMMKHIINACKKFTNTIKKFQKDKMPQGVNQNDNCGTIRIGANVGTLFQTIIAWLQEQDKQVAIDIINSISRTKRNLVNNEIVPPYPKSLELLESSDEPTGWIDIIIPNT
ncbi:MAG: type III-A CRISPR-associated RAMP protein Csm5 [Promethearchaeota archaeon]